MDFGLALIVSGAITAAILSIALFVYIHSVRRIFNDVTASTKNALISFGLAGFMTVAVTMAAFIDPRIIIALMGIFFALMISTILYVLYPEGSKAKIGRYLGFIVALAMVIENQLVYHGYLGSSMFQYIGLSILILGSFTLAAILVKDTQSAFTASVVMILTLYLLTGVLSATHFIFDNTEYFILQSFPILVSVAVYASISRPWRSMISIFIVSFAISLGGGLIWSAIVAGDTIIWQFTLVAVIACLCLIFPLNYFVQQGAETGARTPRFIGYVLIALSLLVLAHVNSWVIYMVEILPKEAMEWNEYFVSVDVILGVIAIISFILAGVAASFGERTYAVIHNVLLVIGTALIVLGLYPVRLDRWKANELYPIMLILIVIGMVLLIRVSVRIYRTGVTRAAWTFVTFIFSSLTIGLTVMFSDRLPFEILVGLLTAASALAILSNPLVVTSLSKRFRRTSHEKQLGTV